MFDRLKLFYSFVYHQAKASHYCATIKNKIISYSMYVQIKLFYIFIFNIKMIQKFVANTLSSVSQQRKIQGERLIRSYL